MNTQSLEQQSQNYHRVEQAIEYLSSNFRQQPDLEAIAAYFHLSKYHFQRIFKEWAGVTPSQFLRYLTVEYAKEQLKESRSVLATTLDLGLSSPGRLHDLFVTFEAMTPGEYKAGGEGLDIHFGFHQSPFGSCLVAMTDRGLCALRFLPGDKGEGVFIDLKQEWPSANFQESPGRTAPLVERLFASSDQEGIRQFSLLLKGTNFQVKVWQALLAVPFGALTSYSDLAAAVGKPTATRAVANAVANNPVAYLIPCHRVIKRVGEFHHYRWGASRKKAMIGWEAAKVVDRLSD